MGWEDEEIRKFEELKRASARNDALILARSEMRKVQAPHCWIELQGQLRGLVASFNIKADRTLLEVPDGPASQLVIRREDGVSVQIQYSADLYRARCEYPACPGHNKEYELKVTPVKGNDTTVWFDRSSNTPEQTDAIAAFIVRILLRCGLA